MGEFIAALIGAVVGGALTFFASWWQTKRVLEHETKQARVAAEDERKAARHAVSRMAVLELLPVLAQAEAAVVTSGQDGKGSHNSGYLDLLASAKAARAALLPDVIQKRWGYLHTLAVQLYSAKPASDATERSAWTPAKIARARDDVVAYLQYVHRSLLALINEHDLPADAPMPVLRRVDMAVWLAPDEGGLATG